jgi:hypothetical protein
MNTAGEANTSKCVAAYTQRSMNITSQDVTECILG